MNLFRFSILRYLKHYRFGTQELLPLKEPCRSNLTIKQYIYQGSYDAKKLQCYSRNNFTPLCMYLLLLGQPVSFMHCCDTVLFQRFMHLKACNGYGLNATYQSTILSTCSYLISWKVFKYNFWENLKLMHDNFNKPCSLIWSNDVLMIEIFLTEICIS